MWKVMVGFALLMMVCAGIALSMDDWLLWVAAEGFAIYGFDQAYRDLKRQRATHLPRGSQRIG